MAIRLSDSHIEKRQSAYPSPLLSAKTRILGAKRRQQQRLRPRIYDGLNVCCFVSTSWNVAEPRDELLTVEEVAEWLPLDKQTVRKFIDRGQLGAVYLGSRRVRIRRSEIERFIAAGETQPKDQPEDDQPKENPDELSTAMVEILRTATAEDSTGLATTLRTLAKAPRGWPLSLTTVRVLRPRSSM
jgi:excisionase family DNA binding protein